MRDNWKESDSELVTKLVEDILNLISSEFEKKCAPEIDRPWLGNLVMYSLFATYLVNFILPNKRAEFLEDWVDKMVKVIEKLQEREVL